MSGSIRLTQDGHVATITIDRPEKLNTITVEMGRSIEAIAREINAEDEIRVVIVRSTGDRAFCAGSDVSTLGEYGANWRMRNRLDHGLDYIVPLWRVRKPMIAAIRGFCIGGGMEVALCCDLRIATPASRFGTGEIKLGWHAGSGNVTLLPRVIGPGNAARLLLTGDLVDAARAQAMGLVQEIVEDDQLEAHVAELAGRIAANAPIAVQLTKHLVRVAQSTTLEVGLAYENDLFSYTMTTDDAKEGLAAFLEKRPPTFRGS
jgi:enoyl-CoA hydratase/carnithine racemase